MTRLTLFVLMLKFISPIISIFMVIDLFMKGNFGGAIVIIGLNLALFGFTVRPENERNFHVLFRQFWWIVVAIGVVISLVIQ